MKGKEKREEAGDKIAEKAVRPKGQPGQTLATGKLGQKSKAIEIGTEGQMHAIRTLDQSGWLFPNGL